MAALPTHQVCNDDLCDDWPVFYSLKEAQDWVRECCKEIVQANLGPDGLGDSRGRFAGYSPSRMEEELFAEHVGTIEPYKPARLA